MRLCRWASCSHTPFLLRRHTSHHVCCTWVIYYGARNRMLLHNTLKRIVVIQVWLRSVCVRPLPLFRICTLSWSGQIVEGTQHSRQSSTNGYSDGTECQSPQKLTFKESSRVMPSWLVTGNLAFKSRKVKYALRVVLLCRRNTLSISLSE